MSNEKLEKAALAILAGADSGAAFLRGLADRRVAPDQDAISSMKAMDDVLPDRKIDPEKVLAQLTRFGSPAAAASAGGRFFGLITGGALPAALGARTLASAWDQIVFNDATSPIGIHLENIASRWLLELFDLPAESSVGFVTGATMANFTCLAGARQAILQRQGWNVAAQGLNGAPPIRLVASDEAHVTILKAISLLGFGTDAVERVPCDLQGRLRVDALPSLDENTIVLLQAGNINSGGIDPIGDICRLSKNTGAWIHVDGAFGLWAAGSPTKQYLLEGYEQADSWVVDGHKWLNTPYDCGIAICRHPSAIHAAMATQAPYLKAGELAAPKDMVPEFSRSARGVEVWAALCSLGREGIAELVDTCCDHARAFAEGLLNQGFEILNDVVLNQVVATLPGKEHLMSEIAAAVRASGEAWFGPTTWRGREGFRISVSSWVTTKADVDRTLLAIARAKQDICSA